MRRLIIASKLGFAQTVCKRNFHLQVVNTSKSIKDLFSKNSKSAIESFFKNPNLFDATFLIGRKEVSFDEAIKIYKTIENQKKSLQALAEIILCCHRNKEQETFDELYKNKLIPLLNSYTNNDFKSLKEYSWNRLFACLLIYKDQNQLTFFYRTLRAQCPNITLNEGNLRHLLNLFSTWGESDLALQVLESTNTPTIIDYTMVLKSLAGNGRLKEALSLLKKMEEESKVTSDAVLFISLLKSCIDNNFQQEGLKLIEMIKKRKLYSTILNTTIINFYFHFNNPVEALNFFEEQQQLSDDVITYGCVIQGLAKTGNMKEALKLLMSMYEKNFEPDYITFSSLIKHCEENRLIEVGKFLHTLIKEKQIDHISINTALISFYAQCVGDIKQSLNIFEKMKSRNNTCWNSIIQVFTINGRIEEAFTLYNKMKIETKPDVVTFIILLKACANYCNQTIGQKLHNDIIHYGINNDQQLMTSLIVFYSKCGDLKKSLDLFETSKLTNIIAWNAIIQLLISQKKIDEALAMVKELKIYKLEPDAILYSNILKACADFSKFEEGVAIHKQILKSTTTTTATTSLINDATLQMSLLYFYGKKGDITICLDIFNKMKDSNMANLSAYTSIIYALISNKQIEIAFSLFNEMTERSDSVLLSILLKACADHSKFKEGEKLHQIINNNNYEVDITLATALVYFYCKANPKIAFNLFNDFKNSGKSNTLMWNSMIQLLLSNGRLEEALNTFHQYSTYNITPDNVTFTTILQACAEHNDLAKGKIIHNYIKENNLEGDVMLDRSLINFYSKCAELEMAKSLFHSIVENKKEMNSFIFNAILFACAEHGQANDCFLIFKQMIESGIQPTPETFTALLTVCSHCHLHIKALSIYNSMEKEFNVKPSNIHTSCLIDALSRSGDLHKALEIIGESKEKVFWMTLLGACRKHNNIEMAEKAFHSLINIDPMDGSYYVLLSNIYTFNNEMEKANKIRDLMKKNGALKITGITSVYIGDEIHTFTSDDKKHPDFYLIQKELDKLISELMEAGYTPDTRWVTRTETLTIEEKRQLLCRHSEKIAMAYAFVRMPNTPQITLFKNLRVCGDCHEATKFISKVRKCKIVVRDASRYHHFENGKCSCGDNW